MNESEWHNNIEKLKSVERLNVSKKEIYHELKNSLLNSLPNESFGILLSGGIDSSLIAKICKDQDLNFRCFCVGIKDAQDLLAAKETARILDLELVSKEFELEEIEDLLLKAIEILPRPKIENDNYIEYMVKLSVSAVMLAGLNLGKETHFISGIGAEELFAGYNRHRKALDTGGMWRGNIIKELKEESWEGLKRFHNLVISRDKAISESIGKSILSPYISNEMIILAMNLQNEDKIDSISNKKILREIATEIGVPKIAAERKKKGAQYGSGFDKAILKLAKLSGFKLKKRYIESLLNKLKT
ncbi:MAG: hypothetical protein CMB06_03825 [Euryarchaeota archaeon]|nr:hypothetical protein [Euryarchaeota archaeon]